MEISTMDPTACLILLLKCLAERDLEGADEAYENLCVWITKGGFVPQNIEAAVEALRGSAAG